MVWWWKKKKITKNLAGGRKNFYTDIPHYDLSAFPSSQSLFFPISSVVFDTRQFLSSSSLSDIFQNGGRSVRRCHWYRFGCVSVFPVELTFLRAILLPRRFLLTLAAGISVTGKKKNGSEACDAMHANNVLIRLPSSRSLFIELLTSSFRYHLLLRGHLRGCQCRDHCQRAGFFHHSLIRLLHRHGASDR